MESNSLKCSSIQMGHSIELKFGMYIIDYRPTYCVEFGEYWLVFYRSTKKNSYTLRLMELNSLKCSGIQMVHSIELKFGMYIVGHDPAYCVEFGEFRKNSFFTGAKKKKKILVHYSLWNQIVRSMLVYIQYFQLSSNLICAL